MKEKRNVTRRDSLKGLGAMGAVALASPRHILSQDTQSFSVISKSSQSDNREHLFDQVFQTPFIDTHEHLIEEKGRFRGTDHPRVQSDDWTMILNHYLDSDLRTAGMPAEDHEAFFSTGREPVAKWRLIAPYWPYVKNTGYGKAVQIAFSRLYDVDELSEQTVEKVQSGYENVRRPGFYHHILKDLSNIQSCQVNSLEGTPFKRSDMPAFLMQDISIVGMFSFNGFDPYAGPAGISVRTLQDWHRVIDWWFDTYGQYAVAVKSQNAYSRDINYRRVSEEAADSPFTKKRESETLTPDEQKDLEDHLFWYAVQKATEYDLPVKLHTGYYAGDNYMPLSRLINNAGSATDLCLHAPETRFVFMHICYPYYEEILSAAKHYTNAYIDMCWSWIINPIAAKDFLKKYLVTAPANKILTFGGDYIPVEPVIGHATIARQGIALALSELVEEGWMSLDDASGLIDPIMHENAKRIFNLTEKEKILSGVSW